MNLKMAGAHSTTTAGATMPATAQTKLQPRLLGASPGPRAFSGPEGRKSPAIRRSG